MKILLAGGGTLGPVTPLLALVEAWRKRGGDVEFVFVGTPNGPERSIVEDQYHLAFDSIIPVRFPRYVSWEWLIFPVRAARAFTQSMKLLRVEKPDVIVGAGGFTQVPLVMMGWLLGIPSVVMQTDVYPLLSTRLSLPFVRNVFCAWTETASRLRSKKTIITGVPVRSSLKNGSRERAQERFGTDPSVPTILVFGGGTGSMWINEQITGIVALLQSEMNIIHLTGKGKSVLPLPGKSSRYVVCEYLEKGMEDLYALADLIVCRAGLGTISELSALGKSAILIPLPRSIQEKNALNVQQHAAGRVLIQSQTTPNILRHEIIQLISDKKRRNQYAIEMTRLLRTDVADEMIDHLEKFQKKHTSFDVCL